MSLEQLLQGISLGVPAGAVLPGVMVGDTVRVKATLDYRGPAISDIFYAAIGEWRGITWPIDIGYYDEIWVGTVPVSFAETIDWVTYELTADILITEIGLAPWTPGIFDLYVKLNGYPAAGKPKLDNVIEILLKPEFQKFEIASYDKV